MPTINVNGVNPNAQGQPPQGYYSNAFESAKQRHADALSNLEKRGDDPLTPSKFASFDRSIDRLEATIRRFESKFNQSAGLDSRIGALRQGMGSPDAAYRVGNTLRLGNRGQRFAEDRSYSNLAGVQHELRRIESLIDRQAKFASSPAAQASLQRQKDSLYIARQRIASGLSGNHPLVNKVGAGVGFLGNLMSNPILGTALSIAGTVIGAPVVGNKLYAGLLAQQKPYNDFSRSVKDIGRGGGFDSADLMNQIYPSGAASFIPGPGEHRSAAMQALGLGPQDVLANLKNYGAPVRSGDEAFNAAASIRREYLGGTGLSEEQLGQYLGTGRNLGEVAGGGAFNSTSNSYWNKLEKVMADASAAGIDRSRMVSVFTQLQSQSQGLNTNSQGFSNLIERMLGSGAPGARSGADILGFAQGVDKTMGGLGTGQNMGANVVFGSLLSANGGAPRDEESLRKFIHVDKKDWAQNYVATPASQRAMQDYFAAVNRGDPMAYRYLGQLLSGHSDAVNNLLEQSPLYKNAPSYQQDVIRSNVLGVTLPQSIEAGSTQATPGNAPGANTQQRAQLEMQRLQRDLNLTPEQAAGFAGALQGEGMSTGNEAGKPFGQGGFGIAQWTGSRRKQFMAWAQSQGMDPSSYSTQQAYLEQELQTKYPQVLQNLRGATSVDDATKASLPYLFGDGSTPDSAGLYAQHGTERMQMAEHIQRLHREQPTARA